MTAAALATNHFHGFIHVLLNIIKDKPNTKACFCAIIVLILSKIKERSGRMALSTLTARVDEADKSAFDSFCNSLGLTTSAAINMYVKAVLRERRIPFEIRQDDPFYSASNQVYI
jgi:DNA-damage-inducible protein J